MESNQNITTNGLALEFFSSKLFCDPINRNNGKFIHIYTRNENYCQEEKRSSLARLKNLR